jgi:hypothetical protein
LRKKSHSGYKGMLFFFINLTSYERKNRLQVSLCYWCVQSNV